MVKTACWDKWGGARSAGRGRHGSARRRRADRQGLREPAREREEEKESDSAAGGVPHVVVEPREKARESARQEGAHVVAERLL